MKKRNILTIVIVFFFVFFGWVLYQNKALGITTYEIDCSLRPKLSGFTMVQISDFHNETFGENQKRIIEKLESCKPNMIAITGDFIDCRYPNVEIAMEFITQAVNIAPVYYVPGNHERWAMEEFQELCHGMKEKGVHLMMDKSEEIIYEGERILCLGIEDPDFYNIVDDNAQKKEVKSRIENLEYSADDFAVLLSHRPELFDIYVEEEVDVALTGHAHGGQFRLPIIGGVAAPNQGLFPKYDAGMFEEKGTHMIVSRGIGNSIIPLRFNNPPEIVVVKLTAK